MEVKNNSLGNFQIAVRVNPDETVEVQNLDGVVVGKKPATPVISTIHIPGGATVIIEDELWNKAMAVKSTVEEYREVEEDIEGVLVDREKVKRVVKIPTGKMRSISPLLEEVRSGRLTIIEAPALELTPLEMKEAIEAEGLSVSKDITREALEALYRKVV